MKLLNVRLDTEDARKAAALRKDGVEISTLVREAIRAEYQRRGHQHRNGQTAAELVNSLFEKFPDPSDSTARMYDVHNARQARGAITAKLKKRKRIR